jgi:hypothetical protein
MFKFMAAGLLPHFSRFYQESHVWTTDAEEEGENLNPWVQWVTIHSGLSAQEHGVRWLSEGSKLPVKATWDILSEAGFRVWVCGSMNARYDKPLHGFLLPDPWSTGLSPYPEGEFEHYYDFVRNHVQEHSNPNQTSSKGSAFRFLRYMMFHGLSIRTTMLVLGQLLAERRGRGHWKRAALMDRFQWDVFTHYYRELRPDFSTFFLNSTAHYQHTYWRNMDPESFQVKPPEAENRQYSAAIQFGYQQMDVLMGRFMKMARRDTTLIFCTGLSQQPYLKAEGKGGRHYYRLIGPKVIVDPLGVKDKFEYNPVMSDQALLRFADEESCARAQDILHSYELAGSRAFLCQPDGSSMLVQCRCTDVVAADAELLQVGTGRRVRFTDVLYSMDVVKSGCHHPDGMLWVRNVTRKHVTHPEKLSIRMISPMVLEHFGISESITERPSAQVSGRRLAPVG